MGAFDNKDDGRLLKVDFRDLAKASIALIARNPAVAALWFVAIYTGALGVDAYVDLGDATKYADHPKWSSIAVYAILRAGLYWLICVVASGFALVLMNINRVISTLSSCRLVNETDVEVPELLEEMRLERQARAAEKRFNDGDTTAAEYRAAITEIEKRRWQLRTAAASKS